MKDFNPFALGSTVPDGYKVTSASTTMQNKHTPDMEPYGRGYKQGRFDAEMDRLNETTPDIEGIIDEVKRQAKIRKWNAPELDYVIREALQSQADQYEREKGEMVADIIKIADQLEAACNKDGDKGTEQWRAFKGFRNTIRDKYGVDLSE